MGPNKGVKFVHKNAHVYNNIIVAQVRDLVRGPFVYILSIGEFFLNQALFSVRLEMFIDFTLIIERKQLLDVD